MRAMHGRFTRRSLPIGSPESSDYAHGILTTLHLEQKAIQWVSKVYSIEEIRESESAYY
jgi:hypothetical protein